METKNLLVIEDEAEIRELIEIILKRQGFNVVALTSVEEFTSQSAALEKTPFDLMILDWMLPGQSGFDFLKAARKKDEWRNIPIILVTAKAEPDEIVMGLEAGADDYLVKPFDAKVLVARVNALLRRPFQVPSALAVSPSNLGSASHLGNLNPSDVFSIGSLRMNLNSYEIFMGADKIALTPTEFKLLVTMAQHEGRVFTREQLVKAAQGEGINVIGRTVDTHVFSLRKKLGELGDCIETARGIGYRFINPEGIS